MSKPGVSFPETRVDNAETIRRVHAQFKGTEKEFSALASAIEHIFHVCKPGPGLRLDGRYHDRVLHLGGERAGPADLVRRFGGVGDLFSPP